MNKQAMDGFFDELIKRATVKQMLKNVKLVSRTKKPLGAKIKDYRYWSRGDRDMNLFHQKQRKQRLLDQLKRKQTQRRSP